MRCRSAARPQAHHTVAGFVHLSDNLMARNDRHLVKREIPLDNVKIGAADGADADFHPNLARPGPRRVHFSLSQRQLLHALLLCQDHRARGFKISG